MKTKAFWVPDKHLYLTTTECLKMWPDQAAALCFSRDEVYIDWPKVWADDRLNFDLQSQKFLEFLVEKQLIGKN